MGRIQVDDLYRVLRNNPDASLFVTDRQRVELSSKYASLNSKNLVSNFTQIFFVAPEFFEFTRGHFVNGRNFSQWEAYGEKSYAVVTQGFVDAVMGKDGLDKYKKVFFKGKDFEILGTWDFFNIKNIKEDKAVFFPLAGLRLLNKDYSPSELNFLVRGNIQDNISKLRASLLGLHSLNRKTASSIQRVQPITLSESVQNQQRWKNRIQPIGMFLWILMMTGLLFLYFQMSNSIKRNESLFIRRRSIKKSNFRTALDMWFIYVLFLLKYLFIVSIVYLFVRLALGLALRLELSLYPELGVQFFVFLISVLIMSFFIFYFHARKKTYWPKWLYLTKKGSVF